MFSRLICFFDVVAFWFFCSERSSCSFFHFSWGIFFLMQSSWMYLLYFNVPVYFWFANLYLRGSLVTLKFVQSVRCKFVLVCQLTVYHDCTYYQCRCDIEVLKFHICILWSANIILYLISILLARSSIQLGLLLLYCFFFLFLFPHNIFDV